MVTGPSSLPLALTTHRVAAAGVMCLQAASAPQRYIMRVKPQASPTLIRSICDQLATGFSALNFTIPFSGACDLDSSVSGGRCWHPRCMQRCKWARARLL